MRHQFKVKKRRQNKPIPSDEPWPMNELHGEFEQMIREAQETGKKLTAKQLARITDSVAKSAGKGVYKRLIDTAPEMLLDRRKNTCDFERRNLKRWGKSFDLIESIWVSCEELGRSFNQHYRPESVRNQDYVFESLTYLQAKALLITSEIICLLKGGFADGALTRWRTLYETTVVAALIHQEGQDLVD